MEDDLLTLSKILEKLSKLEQNQPYDFSTIVLTTYLQVEELINKNKNLNFDIILLDRDCKLVGADKIISISSVPEFNEQAKKSRNKYQVGNYSIAKCFGSGKYLA